MALNLIVKVHPVVLFQIVDAFERRNADAQRVIGTLLGTADKGVVEVTNCFCVPHKEHEELISNSAIVTVDLNALKMDTCNGSETLAAYIHNVNTVHNSRLTRSNPEDKVEAELTYAGDMYDMNMKVNKLENIVGWWATGNEVTSHSSVIHEYYSRECTNPVHMTLDTTLTGAHMGIKAYLNVPIGVPGGKSGSMFTPVPVEVLCYEPEVVGIKLCQKTLNTKKSVEPMSDLALIGEASVKLSALLDNVLAYVDDVLAERKQPNNAVGRALLDMVHSVPKMTPEQFENMFNSNIKDLLMVVTLCQLTKTQLQLNEKLTLLTSV